MTDSLKHWDKVYNNKVHSQLSWHQDESTISLSWITDYANKTDHIIDIGSGISILADNLIDNGYQYLSLLEISPTAIKVTKDRLGNKAKNVTFYNKNVLDFSPDKMYTLWHDRAVFHFLTDTNEQQIYIDKLNKYISPRGYFILATFSKTGPSECSDLKIIQYDEETISRMLSDNFILINSTSENHPRPNGETQSFNYFCFQKKQ